MANPHPVTKGRKRGVPNKFSIARVERAIAEGRKQPPEELLRNAENCRAMAARYAPMWTNQDTKQPEANPKGSFGPGFCPRLAVRASPLRRLSRRGLRPRHTGPQSCPPPRGVERIEASLFTKAFHSFEAS